MEKKARRHRKRGDIIAEVENTKGLIEIEIFDEGIIDKFLIQEGTKVPVGTVMALLQPSGVSLDTKKEKKLSHCNQPKQSVRRARLKYEK
jgi:pyruvate dehydrogenase E2 component (dihydrolipoamide acetyltransferase)